METPVAVFTSGFSPLARVLGKSLRSKFIVAYWDEYIAEKRNEIADEVLNYAYLRSSEEADILNTLQSNLATFNNVRLLVNVVDYREFQDWKILESMAPQAIRAKVAAKLEMIMSVSKVLAKQMACQPKVHGVKGHIINICNFGPTSECSLHMNLIYGALINSTATVSAHLKPLAIRVNSISLDAPLLLLSSATQTEEETTIIETLMKVVFDPTVNSMNFIVKSQPHI